MSKRDGDDLLPVHYLNVKKGGKNAHDEFVSYYLRRAQIIIETVQMKKLMDKNNRILYEEFIDKLPSLEDIATELLYCFAKKISEGMEIESAEEFGHTMRLYIIEFCSRFFDAKEIQNYMHEQLKDICQKVYEGSQDAEEKLWDYEKNILIIISYKTSNEYLFSNHTKVAQRVMEEFVNQVKRYGTKDSKGEQIRSYWLYLNRIIKCRMLDQIKREKKVFGQTPPEGQEMEMKNIWAESTKLMEDIDTWDELEREKLKKIVERLDPIEKLILFDFIIDRKRAKEVIGRIDKIFGEHYTPDKLSRMKKKIIEKLRRFYLDDSTSYEKRYMYNTTMSF